MITQVKYLDVVRLFEKRIDEGVYSSTKVPGERKLALEMGVSHMTARRATQELLKKRRLIRLASGRLSVRPKSINNKKMKRIAFVMPAFHSSSSLRFHYSLSRLMEDRGGIAMPVVFTNWHDPVITSTLDSDYDGIFMIPPVDMPDVLKDRIARQRHRIVTIATDLTEYGVLCLDTSKPMFIGKIISHLTSLGHNRIDCLNTLPIASIVEQRINNWKKYIGQNDCYGVLHNYPVRPFEYSDQHAYKMTLKLLDDDKIKASALFCTSVSSVIGVIRACHERGVRIPEDLSVCSCDSVSDARLLVPSVTTLESADPREIFIKGLDWIACGGKGWNGPLKIEPEEVSLWVGESTGNVSKWKGG